MGRNGDKDHQMQLETSNEIVKQTTIRRKEEKTATCWHAM
jgi:hypothetical protein